MISREHPLANSKPKLLYKYLHPDRIDVLRNRKIRLTTPRDFNDPFDVYPIILPYDTKRTEHLWPHESVKTELARRYAAAGRLQLLYEQIPIDEFGERRLSALPKYGALCLSEVRDNLLMWSHYAAEHRGLVLELDALSAFLAGARKLTYTDKRAALSFNVNQELLHELSFFYEKSTAWSYEREWRMVSKLCWASEILNLETGQIHLFDLPSTAILGVILGARMSSVDREAIVAALSSPHYRHVHVQHAQMSADTFALEFRSIRERRPPIPSSTQRDRTSD